MDDPSNPSPLADVFREDEPYMDLHAHGIPKNYHHESCLRSLILNHALPPGSEIMKKREKQKLAPQCPYVVNHLCSMAKTPNRGNYINLVEDVQYLKMRMLYRPKTNFASDFLLFPFNFQQIMISRKRKNERMERQTQIVFNKGSRPKVEHG
ncbi:hypothetical protein I7I51_07985 [Histoplasma capsulatum]|uniref:Uncharacterized protein n=1 Tax=Ajellomyces capsulatus TaxID=5037 RepID=A0A8A1LWL1_AJECA|nr:hypothetical protein I7I51_07985 [Histoplasma capsulatum]